MKRRIIALSVCLLLCLCSTALAIGEDGSFEDTIPVFAPVAAEQGAVMENIGVTATETGTVLFTREDFESRLTGEDVLMGVIITTMPTTGRLSLDGRALMAGEAVTVEQLSGMSYIPADVTPPSVGFQVLPVLSSGVIKIPVTVNMSLHKEGNAPPVAENISIQTYKNVPITGYLRARDPDGDALEYKLMSKPKRGDITLGQGGEFTYSPYKNKTGKDTVTFVVSDSFGNLSSEATITIEIEKSSIKSTYVDMDGHPAAYASIRLMEENIFVGEQVCGDSYFRPDEQVSRGEFIAMTLRALENSDIQPSVVTGFADDNAIPVWVKPYAQAALKSGIISGVESPDGRKNFLADRPITMSEAIVVLNNAIRVADVNAQADTAVPVWAAQASVNMDAMGVLPVMMTVDQWHADITRADAAELLNRAMNIARDGKSNSGLLSWVFGY